MRNRRHFFVFPLQKHICSLAFCIALLFCILPVGAVVTTIDPDADPDLKLPINEAQRLITLQQTLFPSIASSISPNGKFVVTFTADSGFVIRNLRTNKEVALDDEVYNLQALTELRWVNNLLLTYFATNQAGETCRVKINRCTGKLIVTPMELPGYPLSLSNKGTTLFLVRLIQPLQKAPDTSQRVQAPPSPIKKVNILGGFKKPGPATYAYEERQTVPVATAFISGFLYNIATGKETPLLELEKDTVLASIDWSPRDCSLGIIRWRARDSSRSGQLTENTLEVQDALGQLPPSQNPYYTSNSLDIFHIHPKRVKHQIIKPAIKDRAIYIDMDWSPNGKFFIAQMWNTSRPEGRLYPSYAFFNSSKYRYFNRHGKRITDLDSPKISALSGIPHLISSRELLIHAPLEMDFKIFAVNLFTKRLRPLPTPAGTIYQMAASTRTREVVYNHSSYHQPYELYKLRLNASRPVQLTAINEQIRALNKVQVDRFDFTLGNNDTRTGYLIQPEGTPDFAHNTPMVIWQQGGPTSPMTQEWGHIVELPFNLLPNFGVSVLVTPLPGRDGFGAEFLDALSDDDNFGQIDINEQVEIIDQMVQSGYTSWDHTGVTGCSYGGYFTAQSITSHRETYAAANPQCSLLDLFHEWEKGYTTSIAHLMGTPPSDDYLQDSPLQNGENVDTPTLIFAGTKDFLPSELSKQFHDKINSTGTPVSYYEFLGEGHGLRRATSQFAAAQAQIEWFRYFLQP